MAYFIWTKMEAEGGRSLGSILSIKEAERAAGNGIFWWGIGNSLGTAVIDAAKQSGGTLPIIFSRMLSRAQKHDSNPEEVHLWTSWEDESGQVHSTPNHVLNWSRGHNRRAHYALVCRSDQPLNLDHSSPFNPALCQTHRGNSPGASQVTALLQGDLTADHSSGAYDLGFRATLVEPWVVKLVNPRPLTTEERLVHGSWKKDADWQKFVSQFRVPRP